MKKILVPVVDWPVLSEIAYRISDTADSLGADIIVLFVIHNFDHRSYRRGNLAIELFEEAAQNYSFAVDGYIVSGNPDETICHFANKWEVDFVLLDGSEALERDEWMKQTKFRSWLPNPTARLIPTERIR